MMGNKGLNFNKGKGFGDCYTTITLEADFEDVSSTINSLLQYLHSANEDLVNNNDRFRICELIKAMLPSIEQMKVLEELQISNVQDKQKSVK